MTHERWLMMSGDRMASPLGKERKGVRGFIVLGPATEPGRMRPTVAHGQVRHGTIGLLFGVLSVDELGELRTFWELPERCSFLEDAHQCVRPKGHAGACRGEDV